MRKLFYLLLAASFGTFGASLSKLACIIAAALLLAGCNQNPPSVGSSNAATILLVNDSKNTVSLFIETPKNPSLLVQAEPHSTSEPMRVQDDLGNNIEDNVRVRIRMWDADAVTEREIYTRNMVFQRNHKHVFTINPAYSVYYEMQSLY